MSEGLTIQQAVDKAKARSSESANVPTEQQAEAQDVTKDTQLPQVDEQQDVVTDESEESEQDEIEQGDTSEEESDLFYDLDGEEVSAKQLREWKSGAMKSADYTRKTQELSKKSKEFEQLQADFNEKQSRLDAKLAEVEAIIADETLSDDAIKDLRDYEPDKYIEYTERLQKRKKLIEDAKATKPKGDFQKEYATFAKSVDGWFEGEKPTEKAKKDIAVMTAYAEKLGFTDSDLSGLKAPHFKMLLDAAKYQSTKNTNASLTKQVRKAPVTTKPRQGITSSLEQELKTAQDRFNRTGTVADGVALRKIKSKLNK